tara:strand:- start:1117 stop:1371 length:255 start_codon:yes stop_codon:yes gene_type:complete
MELKKNITIVFKNNYLVDDYDEFGGGTYSVEYDSAEIKLKGEYLLLSTVLSDSSIKTEVHPLKTIKAFKHDKPKSQIGDLREHL